MKLGYTDGWNIIGLIALTDGYVGCDCELVLNVGG